jgi:hypothetical protein
MEGGAVRPIPEPFPTHLESEVDYFLRCLEHEDWVAASDTLGIAFDLGESLGRVPPDRNPFEAKDE